MSIHEDKSAYQDMNPHEDISANEDMSAHVQIRLKNPEGLSYAGVKVGRLRLCADNEPGLLLFGRHQLRRQPLSCGSSGKSAECGLS